MRSVALVSLSCLSSLSLPLSTHSYCDSRTNPHTTRMKHSDPEWSCTGLQTAGNFCRSQNSRTITGSHLLLFGFQHRSMSVNVWLSVAIRFLVYFLSASNKAYRFHSLKDES